MSCYYKGVAKRDDGTYHSLFSPELRFRVGQETISESVLNFSPDSEMSEIEQLISICITRNKHIAYKFAESCARHYGKGAILEVGIDNKDIVPRSEYSVRVEEYRVMKLKVLGEEREVLCG